MPQILVCNNYPLDRVWEEVKLKETPDHHLYGINYFHERNYSVELIPFGRVDIGQRLGSLAGRMRLPIPIGDLSQEFSILKRLNNADLIYAPCGGQTELLHYLRAMGLLKVPVVCLMHHPFPRGRMDFLRAAFYKASVSGADALPTLSQAVTEHLRSRYGAGHKAFSMAWGVDLAFYPTSFTSGRGVIAAGRTGRDFPTFAKAASQTRSPATIICLDGHFRGVAAEHVENLKVLVQRDEPPIPGRDAGWMKYPELLSHFAAARAIAIPLYAQESLAGLTSLMDALGMGKAVIMTRNRHIDIDIEAEGIGFFIEPDDVAGWKRAIEWCENHEEESFAMGRRARLLAEKKFNSELFAASMMDVFDRLLGCTHLAVNQQPAIA